MATKVDIDKLLSLTRLLRDPEKGCPWDLKQTFDSVKHCLLDEAQEVIQAIEKKNIDNLQEELGDTLFNLIFLINLAEEQGSFTMQSVIDRVYDKMVYRHPHVFGDKKAKNAQEAYEIFQQAKREARN